MGVKRRPVLPTDDECGSFGCTWPKGHNRGKADVPANHENPPRPRQLTVTPTARFSHFPYDLVARYVNHKVEFTVERLMVGTYEELQTPWTVRKLT